jgi:hypothetical protein
MANIAVAIVVVALPSSLGGDMRLVRKPMDYMRRGKIQIQLLKVTLFFHCKVILT